MTDERQPALNSSFIIPHSAFIFQSRALCWSSEPDVKNSSRSEEHTSELQSRLHLVCRLLLEKKKRHRLDSTFQFPSHTPYVASSRDALHTAAPAHHDDVYALYAPPYIITTGDRPCRIPPSEFPLRCAQAGRSRMQALNSTTCSVAGRRRRW